MNQNANEWVNEFFKNQRNAVGDKPLRLKVELTDEVNGVIRCTDMNNPEGHHRLALVDCDGQANAVFWEPHGSIGSQVVASEGLRSYRSS
jgi:hypothetical protein